MSIKSFAFSHRYREAALIALGVAVAFVSSLFSLQAEALAGAEVENSTTEAALRTTEAAVETTVEAASTSTQNEDPRLALFRERA